MQYAQEAQY